MIKHNLIIFRELYEWYTVQNRIKADRGDKIFAISWRLKRELGFTVRQHKGLVKHDDDIWEVMKADGWNHRYRYEDQIHLDFYSESAQSYFILKYL